MVDFPDLADGLLSLHPYNATAGGRHSDAEGGNDTPPAKRPRLVEQREEGQEQQQQQPQPLPEAGQMMGKAVPEVQESAAQQPGSVQQGRPQQQEQRRVSFSLPNNSLQVRCTSSVTKAQHSV